MDADLPTPDRVDLDPYEVEDEVIAPDDEPVGVAEAEPISASEAPPAATELGPVAAADDAEMSQVEPASVEHAAAGDAAPDAADGRLDLDAIEADLAGVEVALARLSDGTYWTDEVTGEPLPDDVLASSPTARRA